MPTALPWDLPTVIAVLQKVVLCSTNEREFSLYPPCPLDTAVSQLLFIITEALITQAQLFVHYLSLRLKEMPSILRQISFLVRISFEETQYEVPAKH